MEGAVPAADSDLAGLKIDGQTVPFRPVGGLPETERRLSEAALRKQRRRQHVILGQVVPGIQSDPFFPQRRPVEQPDDFPHGALIQLACCIGV